MNTKKSKRIIHQTVIISITMIAWMALIYWMVGVGVGSM